MRITKITPFALHVPVTRSRIADSMHQVTHWGAPGVIIETDSGLCGYGYGGTHAHLATDRLITACISEGYAPLLIGEDPLEVRHLWHKLYHHSPILWVGRAGITHLALSAVDTALWDLKAKAAGMPLWKLLGGNAGKRVEAYNTDGGWLNWTKEELVDDARRLVEGEGYRGVKVKVGSPDPYDDLERVEAVRRVIGPRVKLMVDVNGRWDLTTAINVGRHLADFDVMWIEEPLWFDDLGGHKELARSIQTPIALGEQLYSLDSFKSFISEGAVHYVQASVVRQGGITEWWRVADLALAYRLPVVPHIGDMAQVHAHLSIAHDSCRLMEYIPWLRDCFVEPAQVKDGDFVAPQQPGAGTTLKQEALEQYNAL